MKNNSDIALALITGATIGAVVSVLYAPARGSETRMKIASSAETTADALIRAAEQLKRNATKLYLDEKESIESRLNSIFAQTHHNADELIPLLEQKLKTLQKESLLLKKKAAKK